MQVICRSFKNVTWQFLTLDYQDILNLSFWPEKKFQHEKISHLIQIFYIGSQKICKKGILTFQNQMFYGKLWRSFFLWHRRNNYKAFYPTQKEVIWLHIKVVKVADVPEEPKALIKLLKNTLQYIWFQNKVDVSICSA